MFGPDERSTHERVVTQAVIEVVAARGARLDQEGGPGIYSAEYRLSDGTDDGAIVFLLYAAPENWRVAHDHIGAFIEALGRAHPWREHHVDEFSHEI